MKQPCEKVLKKWTNKRKARGGENAKMARIPIHDKDVEKSGRTRENHSKGGSERKANRHERAT